MPKPAWFDEASKRYEARYHTPSPAWPPNLDEVDRFVRCFDAPYVDAYNGTCALTLGKQAR